MKNFLLCILVCACLSVCACGQTILGNGSVTITSLTLPGKTVTVGQTVTMIALANDTNLDDVTWMCNQAGIGAWSSSNTGIATVGVNTGIVTGVAAGTASISCTIVSPPAAVPPATPVTGSATVTVVAAPQITNPSSSTCTQPCPLTPGTNGVAYSFTLQATGGTLPYTWTVTSGSFTACGVSLATTGVLSGTATTATCSPVTVKITDAGALNTSLPVSLVINASASTGPPNYNGTPSNVSAAYAPSVVPFSGLQSNGVNGPSATGGDNTVVSVPEPGNASGLYANPIVRATNAWSSCGTNNEPVCVAGRNPALITSYSGSADEQHVNTDSTMYHISDTNGSQYLWSFNPATMASALKWYLPSVGINSSPSWSTQNNHTLFFLTNLGNTGTGLILASAEVGMSYPTSPTITQIQDLSFGGLLFPVSYNFPRDTVAAWGADDMFITDFSNSNTQDSARIMVGYKLSTNTASAWNTATGVITLDTAGVITTLIPTCQNCTGGATNPGTFTVHNIRATHNGAFAVVQVSHCDVGVTCYNNNNPYFWLVGTNKIWAINTSGGGHFTEGNVDYVNMYSSPRFAERGVTAGGGVGNPTTVPTTELCPVQSPHDSHDSWNNADATDSINPFFFMTTSVAKAPDYTKCMTREVIALYPPTTSQSGTYKRFAHTYNVPNSCFDDQQDVGFVSQDGKFWFMSSSMSVGLGCMDGTTGTCSLICGNPGQNASRGDVFVVKLQ